MTRDEVAAAWAADRGPGGEYVLHGDGRLTLMRPRYADDRLVEWSPLGVVSGQPAFEWSELETNALCARGHLRALAGESTGWGGIGWIALERAADSRLCWIITSDVSNPFVAVRFAGGFVEAESSFGQLWKVQIGAPTFVEIIDAV